MKTYRYIIILLMLSPVAVFGKDHLPAAAPDTINPFLELIKIEDYYRRTGDSLFSADSSVMWGYTYYNQFLDATPVTIDTAWIAFTIWGDKMYQRFNSSKFVIQDSLYMVIIDQTAQSIEVLPPARIFTHLFHIDLLDTLLYARQVDSITISNTNDPVHGPNLKKMVFHFKEASPYYRYELTYNPLLYRIEKLQYYIRDLTYTPVKYNRITVEHQSTYYWYYIIEEMNFNTATIIKRENGQFIPIGYYSDYKVINSL